MKTTYTQALNIFHEQIQIYITITFAFKKFKQWTIEKEETKKIYIQDIFIVDVKDKLGH